MALLSTSERTHVKLMNFLRTCLTSCKNFLGSSHLAVLSVSIIATLVFIAIFGRFLMLCDPNQPKLSDQFQPPSWSHPFGTDIFGRDLYSRVIDATPIDLFIAFTSVSIGCLIGVQVGIVAAYYGGIIDEIIMRLNDGIMAFPMFLLGMGLVSALGATVQNVIVATIIINVPTYARVIRSHVLSEKEKMYVEAARSIGASAPRIMFWHIMPNCIGPILTAATMNLGWAILNAAGLSFIGLGIKPPQSEWGLLVKQGSEYLLSGIWWLSLFPALFLVLAVFSFNSLGDSIGDFMKKRG